MDVKGLYPSCKIEKSCSNIEKAFRMTGLEFQNIDAQFLVKLVSVITRGQHSDPEIKKFLLKPKPRTSLNSLLKHPSMNQFHGPPEKDFNELTGPQINTILGSLTAKCVQTVMKKHYFAVGQKSLGNVMKAQLDLT